MVLRDSLPGPWRPERLVFGSMDLGLSWSIWVRPKNCPICIFSAEFSVICKTTKTCSLPFLKTVPYRKLYKLFGNFFGAHWILGPLRKVSRSHGPIKSVQIFESPTVTQISWSMSADADWSASTSRRTTIATETTLTLIDNMQMPAQLIMI